MLSIPPYWALAKSEWLNYEALVISVHDRLNVFSCILLLRLWGVRCSGVNLL
jgi:hypothetical protein